METLMERVKHIMINYPKTRDNIDSLCEMYSGVFGETLNAKLISTIVRYRALIENAHPTLRGITYYERRSKGRKDRKFFTEVQIVENGIARTEYLKSGTEKFIGNTNIPNHNRSLIQKFISLFK